MSPEPSAVPEPLGGAVDEPTRVGLFVTCIVDAMRPIVGFAAAKLLREAGCEVVVPEQTCCGQPAYNAGDRRGARAVARTVLSAFADVDYVVVPSGSCASTVIHHYPTLFENEAEASSARALAVKTYELTQFLLDVRKVKDLDAAFTGSVTYHDSCSGLRELGIEAQPRALLDSIECLSLAEMEDSDVCCGFGGLFCIKYPEISADIVARKCANIAASGAGTLLAGDLGCLINMQGRLAREGIPVRARHVAEVLAGMAEGPAIGEPGE